MSHEEYQGLLLRYFYQELEGAEKEEFEAHLYQCRICQQALQELSGLSFQLEELEGFKPTPRLQRAIKKQAQKSLKKPLWERIFQPGAQLRWPVSLAVALMIFSIIAVMVWRVPSGIEREAYSLWQVAENLEAISSESQSLAYVFPNLSEQELLEEGFESNYSSQPTDSLSQLELELEEIEMLAEGIFEI